MKFLLLLPILGFAFGCSGKKIADSGNGNDVAGSTATPTFSLKDAVAIGQLAVSDSLSLNSGDSKTNVVVLRADGTTAKGSDGEIESFTSLKNGVLFTAKGGQKFFVKKDGTQIKIDVSAEVVGENSNGDIVFADASVYSQKSATLEKLRTTLSQVRVQQMSGNFAIITDGSVYQLLDTVSSSRYNVANCNGPRIAALDSIKAFVDDCSQNPLIDMTTGERKSVFSFNSFNNEFILTTDGAIFISQSCPSSVSMAYRLCRVRANGEVLSLVSAGFSPGASSCMNCGSKNSVLFGSGEYLVVRELTQVSFVKIGVDEKKVLLPGVNITGVSVRGSEVYYFGEDSKGNPITGRYNLISNADEKFPISAKLLRLSVINE